MQPAPRSNQCRFAEFSIRATANAFSTLLLYRLLSFSEPVGISKKKKEKKGGKKGKRAATYTRYVDCAQYFLFRTHASDKLALFTGSCNSAHENYSADTDRARTMEKLGYVRGVFHGSPFAIVRTVETDTVKGGKTNLAMLADKKSVHESTTDALFHQLRFPSSHLRNDSTNSVVLLREFLARKCPSIQKHLAWEDPFVWTFADSLYADQKGSRMIAIHNDKSEHNRFS